MCEDAKETGIILVASFEVCESLDGKTIYIASVAIVEFDIKNISLNRQSIKHIMKKMKNTQSD